MSGQQMPNLQAGFKNNIGPQGPQVELPPPQVITTYGSQEPNRI